MTEQDTTNYYNLTKKSSLDSKYCNYAIFFAIVFILNFLTLAVIGDENLIIDSFLSTVFFLLFQWLYLLFRKRNN